ncbi:MAG TPA: glutamate synthase [Polyangia bacterium]|nr:glutamate synthase [Polyangia bacterium]
MAELSPQPLTHLLRRMVAEKARSGAIFDLPARTFWPGSPLDLSVRFHGARAATCAGPAAGPQSQLAQNIVLSWLCGARILELKTIQVDDRLQIPRPCIDATNVGYNIEWSQELRLEDSLYEYAKAWLLVHFLKKWNPSGLRADEMDTLFDVSVGYSLDGIKSDPVARWLDALRDARPLLARLAGELAREPDLARLFEGVEPPAQIYDCVTLSTFHGCPADEIERIVEHLYARHGLHVVIKLNPTLLGLETVAHILHDQLGYRDIRVHAPSFAADLQWNDALGMVGRLEVAAARAGRTLGVKFTNTLVVENHRRFFPASEKLMYLSGAPLHVLAVQLAHRFTEATAGRFPVSFSAGIDKNNFHEAVACGLVPVTTCTDLLRPGGYGRMVRYLDNLEAEMNEAGARTVGELAEQRGGVRRALAEYARRVLQDPRYAVGKNQGVPRRIGRELALFDCINCDKCVPVCPNDANFTIETPHVGPLDCQTLVVWENGEVRAEAEVGEAAAAGAGEEGAEGSGPGRFQLADTHQLANFADFCNDCGNCDVFCPETGGPYKIKPRFFSSLGSYRAAAHLDGFVVEPGRMTGRIEGVEYHLRLGGTLAEFADAHISARLDAATGMLLEASAPPGAPAGHRMPLWRYHAMRALYEGVMAGINPASARYLRLDLQGSS